MWDNLSQISNLSAGILFEILYIQERFYLEHIRLLEVLSFFGVEKMSFHEILDKYIPESEREFVDHILYGKRNDERFVLFEKKHFLVVPYHSMRQ